MVSTGMTNKVYDKCNRLAYNISIFLLERRHYNHLAYKLVIRPYFFHTVGTFQPKTTIQIDILKISSNRKKKKLNHQSLDNSKPQEKSWLIITLKFFS